MENGRGVRQSTQVWEPQTLQRFCQIGSAHILRRQGDSEDVRKWWGGQWVCREGLSQGRDNDQFVDETAQVTRCMDLELDEAARAFRPVDVQHSPSIWFFYVLKLIFWLPKQHLSWPRDSILQCDAIWILNLLPGLASKGVGRLRSCLSVLFLDENRLLAELYMHRRLDIGVFLSLDNDDKTDTIHFAGIIYCPIPPDSRKFLQNHNMSPSPKTTTSVH